VPGQPVVPRLGSAPATAPAAACGHRNLDRRSPTRTGSVEDSSEYLQRVKFQSKSRDNTTASLRGEKLKLAKVEGRADGPTVPAGDRRRSPGRTVTVQRRPGGLGRPSGKT
jgi:hypothetical protein